MTADDFRTWRMKMDLTAVDAAQVLGISRTTIRSYERGQAIPLYVALACSALLYRLPPYSAKIS